ncbi:protocadherin-like protein isoform X1 [Montipora capricornis]|uniref:protocadherin-like protein isoform X1 n=2 Tax=Montipora capricornis TaxID=246305 RepID=UPI0035F217FA
MLGHRKTLPRGDCPINCGSLIAIVCCLSLAENASCYETVEVYEGLPPGSAILKLKRINGMSYSLYQDSSTADGSSLFYIDSSGILASKVALDHEDERGNVFDLLVISREVAKTEGGFGSIVRVRILDLNDNPPKFPKDLYTTSVSENCRIGTYVTGLESVFASDLDSEKNSVEKYSIVAGNEEEKFSVDFRELSGVKFLRLKTKAPIDREETPFFVLTVQVEDGGNPSLKSTTHVRVNILDENDQAPTFAPPTFSVAVSENVAVGTSVLQVKAIDADIGRNAEIYYYFHPGHDFFTINAHTGIVETACQLHFQKGNSIDLAVYAVDRGSIPHRTKTLVQIRLQDIESYPPLSLGIVSSKFQPPAFHKHAYFVRIREDFPVGGAIVRVEARQGSGVQPHEKAWLYVIYNGPAIIRTIFHINPWSGIITLREPLDYENRTSFSFIVKAQDEQSKDLYDSQTEVDIVIEDVNENHFAPIFTLSSLVVSISEDALQNVVVSSLSANDADEGSNGNISFAISGGSGLGRFKIDQNSGKIRSLVRFTSEMDSQFDLHVRASDHSKQPRYSKAFLLIRLRNSRRKKPFFFNARQVITVRENSLKGTFVALVRAKVRARTPYEEFGLDYHIAGGNEAGKFLLNSTTGIISTAGILDRETQALYILDVRAHIKDADPSMNSLSQVVVMITDENDNTPTFDQEEYKVNVTENVGPISNLLCLAVNDPDSGDNGNVTYTITSSTGPFAIDITSGLLSVTESLNYEHQSLHKVVVEAADNGTPRRKALRNVQILVQDANDPPKFSQNHFTVNVPENADFESTVAELDASDQDRDKNGMFTCSMENMDLETMDTFTVRKTPKGCALVLMGYLEWSAVNRYSFSIRATDHAEAGQRKSAVATVTVDVQDTNNHDPEFLQSSYWVPLTNDAGVDASVVTLKARDRDDGKNGEVRYKLSSEIFQVEPITGVVTLKQGLGTVTNKKYEFSVRATDQGTPNRQTAVMVYVSVHELSYVPPRFPWPVYRAVVAENSKSGKVLLTVHAKKSGGVRRSIQYSIVGGDPLKQFSVSARSGALTLRKQLDYEKRKRHVIVVRAVQNGLTRNHPSLPTEVKVIVNVTDVNDNRPRFAHPVDPLVTSVDEGQPAGAVVTVVRAFDKDTGDRSFIEYGLKDDNFQIDPILGTITTTKMLFHSTDASHTFDITATDSTPPFRVGKAQVVVMVNKAIPPPQFPNKDFSELISENTPVGKSWGNFVPRYNHSTLNYWIAKGDVDNDWCIDTTGKIRLNKRLDHERRRVYHLRINVNDRKKTYPGPTVLFDIEDINDNLPTFSSSYYKFYVSENLPIGHTVGSVSVVDRDVVVNPNLKYSIVGEEDMRSHGKFNINPSSGVLTTKQMLDRENVQQHVMMVRVEDNGKPPLSSIARVTVVVSDVNDNDPLFASELFRAWVQVDAKVGSGIFSVVASDVDFGENGILRYSVVKGNAEKMIDLDPVEGLVTLARPLTALEPIKFKIMARDLGQPARNRTADVVIGVQAVPGPPRFLSPNTAHVKESESAGIEVLRMVAASVDPVISYKILSGNKDGVFHLQPETGLITTTKPLDYETSTHYDLVVMAIDSSNRMNYVKIVIYVDNINDNEPYFVGARETALEGQILADAIAGSNVMWVKAADKDISDVLTYKILDNTADAYFHIDFEGRLKTKKALEGLQSPYIFRIETNDNGIPPKSAFTSVRIVLLKYHIHQKEMQSSIREDVKKNVIIMQVKDSADIKNPLFSIIFPVGSPFSINDETGAIGILRPLDYETTKNYTIIVQVQNSQDLNEYTNIDVVIKVLDVNDNSPVFTMNKTQDLLYLAKVNRNPVRGTVVYKLTASDRDSTGHLRYSLGDDNALFEVEAETGNVKTRGQQVLLAAFYNITVRVSDGGSPSRRTQAVLHVQVGEYPPLFSRDNYVFSVEENTQKGFTVGYIEARSYSGASFSYTVVHGNSDKRFTLDSNTGRLALSNPLDFERDSNVYGIRIRAEEVGVIPKQSSEVNVQIVLKDLNDNIPEFSQQRYRYTLPESVPVGTTVLSVSARDSDSGMNGQFRYDVDDPHFQVNPYTGEISTVKPLDFETSRSHIFVVVANDGGMPVLTGTARVEVTLGNVNDNPPRFLQPMYNEYVNEDAGPGELVTTVQANDLDLDPVSYSIISGDNSSNFVMDNRTGVVRLVSHRKPNLILPFYFLNISASDGVHVSQAMLIVAVLDINNHKPVFRDCGKYRPVIAENMSPGSSVLQVRAEDGDMGDNGKVSYHIERPTAGVPYFKIDINSGLVTTAASFDREKKRSYQIRITGKDGGPDRQEAERLMGFCQVEIMIDDVNDNPPVFGNKRYETSVKEDSEIGQTVLQVSATDKDTGSNALITYSFEKLNTHFSISSVTGIITTNRSLASSEYAFSVVARDNGLPPRQSRAYVIISVYKVGKNPPKFEKEVYFARVAEDLPPGEIVMRVTATTPDPSKMMIYYTIENYPQPFTIAPATGVLSTTQALDYESSPNYTVHIRAQDTQDPPLVSFTRLEILVEDVNDSPPEFPVSKYEGQVAENLPIGTSVIEVEANDPDKGQNGLVSYSFNRKESYDDFDLDSVTGLITTKMVFDRERSGRYTLIVEARDHGKVPKKSSCLINVIINDQNDNAPVFKHAVYNISVFEDVALGARLLTVSAVDDDIGNNAIVNYYITSGNKGAAFAITKELGQIVVASSLDRETQDYYHLKIRALDGRNSGSAVVNIHIKDVNDNNPEFSNNTYYAKVYENQPSGSYVTTLSATDKDLGGGGLFLYSISGQGRDAFKIDPKTGVLSTVKPLDRETKARYDFLAFATDNPESEAVSRRTGSCDVVIWIRDINDNAPRFPDDIYEGGVQENQSPGARVMELSAVDDDDPNESGNAIMSYELIDDSSGRFRIERDTGLIRTRVKLDREEEDEYLLVVNATDGGNPALSGHVEVKVKVTDANDHPPRFEERIFLASVFENADIDSPVMILKATDEDVGINAQLRYSITQGAWDDAGNSGNMFHVVEDTGEIRVTRSLDFETKKEYKLEVMVRDSGSPSFSDTAEVTIAVQDFNDNPPVFSPVSYSGEVKENKDPEIFLLQVSASDSDTGSNKEFKFSIAYGDPDGHFRIDPDSGNLYVHRKLDRETRPSYLLKVRATNIAATNLLYGHASVQVRVIDANDNGPVFHPSVFHFSVKENIAPSQSLGKISVDDPDLDPPNGGPFSFEISSGNEEGYFGVHNVTGVFFTRATFDRERRESYMLTIKAFDSGNPQQESATMLYVHVLDENDNQHSSGTLNLDLNSYQGKFPGGVVGKVYVIDKDVNDLRIYEVLTKSSEYFTVARTTGMIISSANPPKGDYSLTIKVSDSNSSFSEVVCSVFIKVKEVTAEAVQNSIAIRLGGVSREGFITTIQPRFKESIAGILGTSEDNVDLFSVQKAPKNPNAIDVRFAAHGSPYYAPERMRALLKNSWDVLAKATKIFKVDILLVGVDECLNELCKSSGCTNVLLANGDVEVISVKKTAFASIIAVVVAKCDDCNEQKKVIQTCSAQLCLNGGTCVDTPDGYVCRCFAGFNGPNCELTTRSFQPGDWLWLRPPQQCSIASLSLEFATKETNGLLLYGGPTSPVRNGDVHDFIAVELTGGKVRVSLSLGDREDLVKVGVTGGVTLNDGEWHHVEVYWNRTLVRVTVDKCREGRKAGAVEDKSDCSSEARLKNNNYTMMNLNNPLQIGGVSTTNLSYPELIITSYKGCIRNVMSQGKYYDLKNPSYTKGTVEECPMIDQHCKRHDCDPRATCVPSWSGHWCSCPLGLTGLTCGKKTVARSYGDGSFTQYLFHLYKFVYDPRETRIHMQIRTRDSDGGVLMFNAGSQEGRYSLLEVVPYNIDGKGERELIVTYTLGSASSRRSPLIQLTGVNVGDGQWHNISVVRERTIVTLSVDSDGGGYSVTERLDEEHALFVLDPTRTFIGDSPILPRMRRDTTRDFVGCINDVRFNDHLLDGFNGTSPVGDVRSIGVREGCISTPVCRRNPCNASKWCRDVWRKFECLPRLCTSKPCKNGGTCLEGVDNNGKSKFHCQCPGGFEGAVCEVESSVVVATIPGVIFEDGLIIGLSVLVVTLVLSVFILIVHLRRSRPRKRHESEEEQHFQPDNVANYRIEGGGEEDLYQEGHLRDILKSFETADFTPCQERFKLSGNNSDVSGPCVVMAPIKKEVNGIRGCKPVQKQVDPETRETDGSFSPGESDQEPPDSSSSPSAVSTPERRRRVRSSSRGELWERQTPEGLESGVDASPTRKLTEIFGLNEEEKEGMRSPPEGFSPPEKFSSLHKRERGNGASLQRPEKAQDCETPEQNGKHGHVLSGVEYTQENSFSMENPLSRPNSDVLTKSNGEGVPSIQRRSLPPKKPPRTGYPRGLPPQAGTFLPEDVMQRFYYEGSGSPTISLSTLGDNEVDSETDDNYEDMNNMGEKFKKLARIYGVPPSVTFSPHDEFIGE